MSTGIVFWWRRGAAVHSGDRAAELLPTEQDVSSQLNRGVKKHALHCRMSRIQIIHAHTQVRGGRPLTYSRVREALNVSHRSPGWN